MTNPRFISYYKAQDILPEQEWDTFLESLRTPLPTTFRVAGSRQTAYTLNENIKNIYVPMLNDVVFEAQNIPPPVQIPWCVISSRVFAWYISLAATGILKV